jgi:hypothetical protein
MAAPLVQDLRASAWGLGQGISLHAHARLRETLGKRSGAVAPLRGLVRRAGGVPPGGSGTSAPGLAGSGR